MGNGFLILVCFYPTKSSTTQKKWYLKLRFYILRPFKGKYEQKFFVEGLKIFSLKTAVTIDKAKMLW